MRKIIDFHSHVFPEKIAEKATVNIGKFYDMPMQRPSGSVAQLLESGKEAGVSQFVVQSVATVADQVESINRFIANECERYPDKLIGLGTMHPDVSDHEKSIDLIQNLGLRGIKLHPDFQTFDIDSPKAFPIYEIAQSKGLCILMHCGDFRYDYSHPRRLANVLKMFPNLKVVAAHFGGWSVWEDATRYLLNENCYVDSSSTLGFTSPEKVKELIDTFGAERVLFGVDFPMWDHKTEVDCLLSLGLTRSQEDNILYKNAVQILAL